MGDVVYIGSGNRAKRVGVSWQLCSSKADPERPGEVVRAGAFRGETSILGECPGIGEPVSRCDTERRHFQTWTPSWGVPNRGGGASTIKTARSDLHAKIYRYIWGLELAVAVLNQAPLLTLSPTQRDIKRRVLVATGRCHDRPIWL